MEKFDIEDLDRLFHVENIDHINLYRKKLNTVTFDWKNQKALDVSLNDFSLQENQYRYNFSINNVKFQCLYFPSHSKKLVISFCGGGRTKEYYSPRFLRWKYYNYYDAHYLCIDDPMYDSVKFYGGVLWYYGRKNESYVEYVVDIVKKFISELKINIEDVVCLGSSGGGTVAIQLANKIPGICCIAINPQFYPYKWSKDINDFFMREYGVDLTSGDPYGRHEISITENSSRFFLVFNSASSIDKEQYVPALEKLNIPIKYGINQYDNIITWIHHTNGINKHVSNPEIIGIKLLMLLNTQIIQHKNINNFNSLSYIINEYMNIIYLERAKQHEILTKKSKKSLAQCIRYYILSKITFGNLRKRYTDKFNKIF